MRQDKTNEPGQEKEPTRKNAGGRYAGPVANLSCWISLIGFLASERRFGELLEIAAEGSRMPERKTLERAAKDARQGKAPTTQAGEFIREEIKHVREGKHGVSFDKTADRHRSFKGPPGRRKAAATEEW
jgi:hypothetical protein